MIRARGLTKDFAVSRSRTVHAVRGVDLDVAPGELVAVLGPNGAGKTTTLRMLTSLLRPTSGRAVVAGHDVVAHPDRVRRAIGYVGQGNGAGHQQRAGDELVTQGVVYGLDRRAARRRAGDLLEALELTDLAQRKVSDLSGGQRRRLDVALGLVHAPALLFLDEPSTGLDPHSRANLWEHVLRLREEHAMTIVLTTHYLDEADGAAGRVVVVDHGHVIADDTPAALKRDLAGDRLVVEAATPADAPRLAALVGALPGGREVAVAGAVVTARVAGGDAAVVALVREADRAGVGLVGARSVPPTLDDVFLALTGRSLREGPEAGEPADGSSTATTEPTDGTDDSTAGRRAAGKDAA